MNPEQEQKLFTTLGYIKKEVENNTEQVKKQNGNVASLTDRVNKHDIFLGKIGLAVATFAFVVSTVAGVTTAVLIRIWK